MDTQNHAVAWLGKPNLALLMDTKAQKRIHHGVLQNIVVLAKTAKIGLNTVEQESQCTKAGQSHFHNFCETWGKGR